MAVENIGTATGMTLAAVVIGLSITEEMSVSDQNMVANLLLAAAQAISTRASLLPEEPDAELTKRVERLEQQGAQTAGSSSPGKKGAGTAGSASPEKSE